MKRVVLFGMCLLLGVLPALAVDGSYIWQRQFGGPGAGDQLQVVGIATDSSGNVYFVAPLEGSVKYDGCARLTSAGVQDVVFGKFDSSGTFQWIKKFGGIGADRGLGIAVDSSANVIVIGSFAGTVNFGGSNLSTTGTADTDIFLLKYSTSGTHIWSKRFGGTGTDEGRAVAVDSSGNILIAGSFGNFGNQQIDFGGGTLTAAGNGDAYVAKYDSSGTYVWAKQMGGTGSDSSLAVAADTSGNAIVVGSFAATVDFGGGGGGLVSGGLKDGFIAKYGAADGAYSFSRRFGGASDDFAYSVATDSTSSILVAAGYNSSMGVDFGGGAHGNTAGPDIAIVKYSSANAFTWEKIVSWPIFFGDFAQSVRVDGSDNVLVSGAFNNPIDFGCGGMPVTTSSYDVFVTKFSSAGACTWSHHYGIVADDYSYAVAVDGSGNVLVGGWFSQGIDFGGGQMNSPGAFDGFLAKLSP